MNETLDHVLDFIGAGLAIVLILFFILWIIGSANPGPFD